MNCHFFDAKRLLGAALLVHLDLFHLGERRERVVADDLAEDGVEPIEMRRLVERNEELGAVRAGPLVGHGDYAAGGMPQGGPDLVVESTAPDRPAALGVAGGGIRMGGGAGLNHE